MFKSKVDALSSEYFADLKRVFVATPEQIRVEEANNVHAEVIKSKFEEKKAKIMKKMKIKQSNFISGA